jgi:hypothetical protein
MRGCSPLSLGSIAPDPTEIKPVRRVDLTISTEDCWTHVAAGNGMYFISGLEDQVGFT